MDAMLCRSINPFCKKIVVFIMASNTIDSNSNLATMEDNFLDFSFTLVKIGTILAIFQSAGTMAESSNLKDNRNPLQSFKVFP